MEFLDFSPVSPRLRKTLKGVALRQASRRLLLRRCRLRLLHLRDDAGFLDDVVDQLALQHDSHAVTPGFADGGDGATQRFCVDLSRVCPAADGNAEVIA
jgi:hypothetical protein